MKRTDFFAIIISSDGISVNHFFRFRRYIMSVISARYAVSRRLSVLLVLFFCFIMLLSCGENTDHQSSSDIAFTDALGRQIQLDGVPARTACLLGSFADVWMLSGGEVCAAAEDAWEDFGFVGDDMINIGGAHSPNTELLLSAAPDFVLASAATASHVALCEVLEAAGIAVAYFDILCFDDYLAMLRICTEITGRNDLYEQNGSHLAAEIADIKQRYTDASLSDNERTVLLLRASSGFVKAKGSEGTILGEMLADMGCINIADSDTSLLENLSIEAIVEKDPHYIFVITMGSDTDAAMQSLSDLIAENPIWQTLDAVQNNRIHVMDKSLFHLKPNAKWATSYQVLYETLLSQTK